MSKLKKNELGFSIVEGALVLVIVGLIGFVGLYVHQSKNTTDRLLSKADNTNATTSIKQKSSDVPHKTNPTPDSGISGQVYYVTSYGNSPTSEVSTSSQPYQATIQIKTQDGSSLAATVTSDAKGTFRVTLAPGKYVLLPQDTDNGHTSSQNQAVTVAPGGYTKVSITYRTPIP